MRPDEHKKKRSAQYKKKHNLTGKNQATKPNQKSNEAGDDGDGEDGSGENGLPEQTLSQFSKRKVTSNWEKYEEPLDFSGSSDEEGSACSIKPLPKYQGADFSTLLKTAAAPSSQFRFQSEKEWEEQDSKLQSASSFLEINLTLITKSIQSLPLHKKLDLDVENIQPDLLETFNSTAGIVSESSCQKPNSSESLQHLPSQNQPKHSKQPISLCDSDEKIQNKNFIFVKPASFSETDVVQNHPRNVDLVNGQQKLSSTQLQSSLKDTVCGSSSGKSSLKTNIEPHVVENDELDELLSLDTPIGSSNQARYLGFKKVHKEIKTTSPEISVEGETKSTTQQLSPKTSKTCKSKMDTMKAAADQDELEDWLDSVLG